MRFSIIEIGWVDMGPIIDLLSIEVRGISHSLFCLGFRPFDIYLEVFGIVLLDTYPDEDLYE